VAAPMELAELMGFILNVLARRCKENAAVIAIADAHKI